MTVSDFIGQTLTDAEQDGDGLVLSLASGGRWRFALGNLAPGDEVIFGMEGELAVLIGPPIVWAAAETEGPVANDTTTSTWVKITLATVLGRVTVLLTAAQTGEDRPVPVFALTTEGAGDWMVLN